MRLLIVNYELDDLSPVLAWQAQVTRALAETCEQVVVLTGRKGQYTLPDNVYVEQLKVDHTRSRINRYIDLNRQALRVCRAFGIQAAFVHMAHRYAYWLYPALWLQRVPILLWYAHGSVTWHLRVALFCAARVVTSTPHGFGIPSPKVHIIGQGVDTDLFKLVPYSPEQTAIVTVSRISQRKRLDLLIDTMACLRDQHRPFRLKIIGTPLTDNDRGYEQTLHEQVAQAGLTNRVSFEGFVPLADLPAQYTSTFLHVNVSQTESMDKTVIEALACGCPVLTSNPAFRDLLRDYELFIAQDEKPQSLAAQISEIYERNSTFDRKALRALVMNQHDLQSYVGRIMEHLHAIRQAN